MESFWFTQVINTKTVLGAIVYEYRRRREMAKAA
jgi:hypothetical protein